MPSKDISSTSTSTFTLFPMWPLLKMLPPLISIPPIIPPSTLLNPRIRLHHLRHTIHTTSRHTKNSKEVGRNKGKGGTTRSDQKGEGGEGVGLVGFDDSVEAEDEYKQSEDESHGEVDEDLEEDFHGVFHHALVA